MPNRFDRALPWALLLCMSSLLFMGIAWDAAFEATPSNIDLVSQGDDRIRDLKVEIGDRGEDELCWGTAVIAGCPSSGDNGFAREGSARGFFATANPAALNNPAATALGAGHDGRIYFDDDGADNVNANNDDNQLKVYDGSAWVTPRWESLGGITLTSIANGEILKYNGTVLVDQAVATLTTFDRADIDNEAFVNNACAGCTVAGVPDHTGGSDTNNYPEVTVPAAPAGVVWDIHVWGHVSYFWDSNDGTGGIGCEVEQDLNDANVFATTATTALGSAPQSTTGDTGSCEWYAVVRGVAAGSLYAFRLRTESIGDGTEDWEIEDTSNTPATYATGELVVEVRPRTIF